MSFFKKLFGSSKSKNNSEIEKAKEIKAEKQEEDIPFELNIGEYIKDPKFGIGKLLSIEKTDQWLKCAFDFDIGTRIKSWKLSEIESIKLERPKKTKIDNHLKYRNYDLGEKRYLTKSEMENLKEGDLVLRNRKGFAKVIGFGKNDKGTEIIHLEYLETGQKNTFNRLDSGGALVRFSLNHDLNNEFWEKIESKSNTPSSIEINKLENELKVTIPQFYKSFLMNFPNELLHYNRNRLNRKEKLYELEVLITIDDIRQNYLFFEAFELNNYWPIGSDGTGNYYAVKQNGEDEYVYFIDHEVAPEKSISVISENLKEFTNQLIMREMVNSYQLLNK